MSEVQTANETGCEELWANMERDAPEPVLAPLRRRAHERGASGVSAWAQRDDVWRQAEAEEYLADVTKDNRRRLHELVAGNQLAATRCFH